MLAAKVLRGRGYLFCPNGLVGCGERGNFRELKTGITMTLTIELKDQLVAKASRIARQKGVTVDKLVEEYFEKLDSPTPIVEEILRLTEGYSLPADTDDKKEYYEARIKKHA